MKKYVNEILDAAEKAQKLIRDLHESFPDHVTFEQLGLLDGEEIINEYIEHNEWGIALEHLLYMIHESDIPFPRATMLHLHEIAEMYKIENYYSKSNQKNLTPEQVAGIYNAP